MLYIFCQWLNYNNLSVTLTEAVKHSYGSNSRRASFPLEPFLVLKHFFQVLITFRTTSRTIISHFLAPRVRAPTLQSFLDAPSAELTLSTSGTTSARQALPSSPLDNILIVIMSPMIMIMMEQRYYGRLWRSVQGTRNKLASGLSIPEMWATMWSMCRVECN